MPKNENEFRCFSVPAAGIFGDIGRRNMPGREYAANEYAEKRKGGRSPEYSGTPPPLLSGKGPDAIW